MHLRELYLHLREMLLDPMSIKILVLFFILVIKGPINITVESSTKSHLNVGEFDHLVAYSLACTFESEVVSARKYESLRVD